MGLPFALAGRAAGALLALAAPALAQEVIVIHSGTVDGLPGAIPTEDNVGPVDDRVTWWSPADGCCAPLVPWAFTPEDFARARGGPPAELVVPHDWWIEALPDHPEARWVHFSHGEIGNPGGWSGSARPPQSVLYAVPFVVETPGDPSATIELRFAADDRLGDWPSGPNLAGAYLNGVPLGGAFQGGGYEAATTAVAHSWPLLTGANTLYLYERDTDGNSSGVLFTCTITIEEDACGGATTYCTPTPNSTGAPAHIGVEGPLVVGAPDTRLTAWDCPPSTIGLFVYGPEQAALPMGDGVLCVSPFDPGLFRMEPTVQVGLDGQALCPLDFAALPPGGQITPGSTWHFQLWYRDPGAAGAGFNLSDGLTLTFCP